VLLNSALQPILCSSYRFLLPHYLASVSNPLAESPAITTTIGSDVASKLSPAPLCPS